MSEAAWSSLLAGFLPALLKRLKSRFELGLIPLALSCLTVLLGVVGWSKLEYHHSFHSAVVVLFRTIGAFKTTFKGDGDLHNNFTDAAAVCGFLTLSSAGIVVALTFLRESLQTFSARLLFRQHVVIIGDTSLARRAERVWQQRGWHPLRIVPPDVAQTSNMRGRAIRHKLDERLVGAFGMRRARHVFIDVGDDMQTFTLAYGLLSSLAEMALVTDGSSPQSEWVIVSRDLPLADHFLLKIKELAQTSAAALPALHFLDPERLAARDFMATHPLFLTAEENAQSRVHLLVIGNGPIGRHLIEMTFLTQLISELAQPLVTVLTKGTSDERKRFFAGRATLADAVDVAFIDCDALETFQDPESVAARALRARESTAPFTLAMLTPEHTAENVSTAMLIAGIQSKYERLQCPIFCYEDDADEANFLTASPDRFGAALGGFRIFGLSGKTLAIQLCDADRRDALARALHSAYAKTVPSTPDWDELSESLRRANRNAADHWRAKLYMLGFDVAGISADVLPVVKGEDIAMTVDGNEPDHDPRFSRTVRVEHLRWCLERYFDGWSSGERNDKRQTNPLLTSWQNLTQKFPAEASKNADQIRAIVIALSHVGDPSVVITKISKQNRPWEQDMPS